MRDLLMRKMAEPGLQRKSTSRANAPRRQDSAWCYSPLRFKLGPSFACRLEVRPPQQLRFRSIALENDGNIVARLGGAAADSQEIRGRARSHLGLNVRTPVTLPFVSPLLSTQQFVLVLAARYLVDILLALSARIPTEPGFAPVSSLGSSHNRPTSAEDNEEALLLRLPAGRSFWGTSKFMTKAKEKKKESLISPALKRRGFTAQNGKEFAGWSPGHKKAR
jgi:hypothetical protein